jgi:dephospho-CoA kinase
MCKKCTEGRKQMKCSNDEIIHQYLAEKLISKDKIKEKIEELEEQLKYNLFKTHEIYTAAENKLLHKIEVLKELLEGE